MRIVKVLVIVLLLVALLMLAAWFALAPRNHRTSQVPPGVAIGRRAA
jgi:uncharacterized membrane protein affecting hemolysin expression